MRTGVSRYLTISLTHYLDLAISLSRYQQPELEFPEHSGAGATVR
jgi:hypothetical protein